MSVMAFHAWAQVAPSLGTAGDFAVLGGSTVTNTGPTLVGASLGVSPGSAVTGFPPGFVLGTTHAADAVALGAQNDTTTAYDNLAGQACDTTYSVPTDLGGQTLVPGVYCFASSAQLTGTLTLNGGGNPGAVFVFKTVSTLVTASNSDVLLLNGAQSCNVFWQVGSSATLGTGTSFVGNIIALTSITLATNATLSGRALARNGAVTLDSNVVAIASCDVSPDAGVTDGGQTDGGVTRGGDGGVTDGGVCPLPALAKAFSPASIIAGGLSTLTITLSNPHETAATLSGPLVDTLPNGVLVAGSASTTCGGIVTTSSSTVTLTGGSIAAGGACTVTVPVSATVAGVYRNSIAAGALQTDQGSNAAAAVAVLTVVAPPHCPVPPVLTKAFAPSTISAGGSSVVTITLTNGDDVAAALLAPLTDLLPSGLLISGSASTTCGGTLTAIAGTSTIRLTGGSIPASGSCSVTVRVNAASFGSYCNKLPPSALKTDHGNNEREAQATLNVLRVNSPPGLRKAFSPAAINVGGSSTLTITLSNPNATEAQLTSALVDSLPSGMAVGGSKSTTCGGTLSAAQRGSRVVLRGGTIPAQGSCTVSVEVTLTRRASCTNVLPVGALRTDLGSNASPASATLKVTRGGPWR